MADLEKTVEIIFGGVDNVSGVTRDIDRQVSQLGRSVSGVTGPLSGMADSLFAVDAAIGVVTAAVLGFSLNAAITYEEAFLDLTKVLGENETVTAAQSKAMEDLSSTYATAGKDVVGVVATFKQAGFTLDESIGLADTALKSFNITELSVDQSTEALKRTIRGFGLEASEAGRVLDVVNAISNDYGVNAAELFEALADISPVARAAGLSLEDIAGAMTPVIEVFGSGSEVARAFKTGLLRLGDDAKPVVKTLTDIGVFADGTSAAFKNNGEILNELARVYPTLNEKQQQFVATQVFGIDQSGKLSLALLEWNRGLAATKTALESTGSAQKEFEVRTRAVGFQLDKLKVNFDGIAKSIGDQFLAQFGGVATSANDLAVAFKSIVNAGTFGPLFEVLNQALGTTDENLKAVAQNLPAAFEGVDFGPIVRAANEIAEAFGVLFGATDLTSVNGLRDAIQLVVDVLGGLGQATAGQVRGLELLVDSVLAGVKGFSSLGDELQQAGGHVLGIAKSVDTLIPVATALTGVMSALGTTLTLFVGVKVAKEIAGIGGAATTAAGFLGKAGFAGAVGVAAFELGKLADLNDRLIPGVDTLGTKIFEVLNPDQASGAALTALSQLEVDARAAGDSFANSEQQLRDLIAEIDALDRAAAMPVLLDFEFDEFAFDDFANIDFFGNAIQSVESGLAEATDAGQQFIKSWKDGVPVFTAVGNAATDATGKAVAGADTATKATDDYLLKLREIESDERLGVIKLAAEVDIAGIEAQTKQVVAAFDSINTGIESTGALIGKLFGDLTEEGGVTNLDALRQIKLENARRDQEFRDQSRLIDAQIAQMRAQAAALNRGDSIITVQADGLKPHLEAIWFEILEEIQVQGRLNPGQTLVGCSA